MAAESRRTVLVGVVVCIVAGVGAAIYYKNRQNAASSTPPPYTIPLGQEPPASPHGMPGDAAHGMPGDAPHGSAEHGMEFVKVHFMRKFLAALTQPPENLMPALDYKPLMKEGAAPLRCVDCHSDPSLNMEAMIANDPGDEAVEPLRMQRHRFMIPLMEKWVERLNKRHADRLTKEVTCTDCHDQDPRDDAVRNATIPPLMVAFVKALREKPGNMNPASGWRPLLKDPNTPSMLCGTCHGQVGLSMERNVAELEGPTPEEAEKNQAFMVRLMERWVRELNKRAKDQLVKVVVCTDCHEVDPRK
jgi:hypothetical protein